MLIRRLAIAALSLLLSAQAYCADVWKISSKSGHLYLGGTFHLLTATDYPLPREYDIAYDAAQTLVLETDLDKLRSPEFQATLQSTLSYDKGQDITTALKPATLKQLESYLATRKMTLTDVAALKPGILSLTLSLVEMRYLGLTGTGVDEHFHLRAKKDGKSIEWFETAEQQLQLIADMGKGYEDDIIVYTLQDMKNMPAMMSEMKKAWREGNSAALEATALASSEKEFPALMNSMLFARNEQWLPVLERMIASKNTELVLVGALHLVGDRGLLAQLQQRGYTVEKVSAVEKVSTIEKVSAANVHRTSIR